MAVNILLTGDDDCLNIDENALRSVLERPDVGKKPIALVSIVGASRKGKSFILNFLLQYLRQNGNSNPNWLTDGGLSCFTGFHWRGGKEPDTKGIEIWREPFFVNSSKGEMAVFFVDTRGLFDGSTNRSTNAQIFALSTLISSVQVVNIFQQVQSSDLDYLEFFLEYARQCCPKYENKPFQCLKYLVRDWPHTCDFEFGVLGGNRYLLDLLNAAEHPSTNSLKSLLNSAFEKVQCFLMPHPGVKIATSQGGESWSLDDLDNEFKKQLDPFAESILHPVNLLPKRIGDDLATANNLIEYICTVSTWFKSPILPQVKSRMEVTADLSSMRAYEQCLERYRESMDKKNLCVAEEELDKFHSQAKCESLEIFDQMAAFGAAKSESRRKDLEDSLDAAFYRYFYLNQSELAKHKVHLAELLDRTMREYTETIIKNINEANSCLDPNVLECLHTSHVCNAVREFECATGQNLRAVTAEHVEKLKDAVQSEYEYYKSRNNENYKRQVSRETTQKSIQLHVELYQSEMAKLCTRPYEALESLFHKHKVAKTLILSTFDSKMLTDEGSSSESHRELETRIDAAFIRIRMTNCEEEVKERKSLSILVNRIRKEAETTFSELPDNTPSSVMWNMVRRLMQQATTDYQKESQESGSAADEYFTVLLDSLQSRLMQILRNRGGDHLEAAGFNDEESGLTDFEKLQLKAQQASEPPRERASQCDTAKLEKLSQDNVDGASGVGEGEILKEMLSIFDHYASSTSERQKGFLPFEVLRKLHETHKDKALSSFDQVTERLCTNTRIGLKYRDVLSQKIDKDYKRTREENAELKVQEENKMQYAIQGIVAEYENAMKASEHPTSGTDKMNETHDCVSSKYLESFERQFGDSQLSSKYKLELNRLITQSYRKLEIARVSQTERERKAKTAKTLDKAVERLFLEYDEALGTRDKYRNDLKTVHIRERLRCTKAFLSIASHTSAKPEEIKAYEQDLEKKIDQQYSVIQQTNDDNKEMEERMAAAVIENLASEHEEKMLRRANDPSVANAVEKDNDAIVDDLNTRLDDAGFSPDITTACKNKLSQKTRRTLRKVYEMKSTMERKRKQTEAEECLSNIVQDCFVQYQNRYEERSKVYVEEEELERDNPYEISLIESMYSSKVERLNRQDLSDLSQQYRTDLKIQLEDWFAVLKKQNERNKMKLYQVHEMFTSKCTSLYAEKMDSILSAGFLLEEEMAAAKNEYKDEVLKIADEYDWKVHAGNPLKERFRIREEIVKRLDEVHEKCRERNESNHSLLAKGFRHIKTKIPWEEIAQLLFGTMKSFVSKYVVPIP